MKKTHIILLLVMAAAVAVLISMSGDFSEYSNFGVAQSDANKNHQVVGYLSLDKAIIYEPTKNPNVFYFSMKDANGLEMKVACLKPKPQDFERSEQIVLTGKVEKDVFVATQMQLKCPSKYQDEANSPLSEK